MSNQNSRSLTEIYDPILASLLVSAEKLELQNFFDRTKPEMFLSQSKKEIFKIIKNCYLDRGHIDINYLTFPDELQSDVMKIMDSHLTTANFESYCDILRENYNKNLFLKILSDVDNFQNETSYNLAADKISALEKLMLLQDEGGYTVRGDELAAATFREIEAMSDPFDLSTGFFKLDNILFLSPGDLCIIGARPAMGKTAFLLSIAKSYAMRGKKVGFFSLEMGARSLMMRMFSSSSGVHFSKILIPKERHSLTAEHMTSLRKASKSAIFENIYFFDEPGASIDTIKFKVKEFVRLYNIEVICIDYLQYIGNNKEFHRPDLKIADTTKELKNLCRKLNLLGVVLAQLNRRTDERHDKQPIMSDLDGSSEIEKTADSICLLYRDDYYNRQSKEPNSLQITVAKQRNGATGIVKLNFLGPYQRVSN